MEYGILSLIPPLVAIVFALKTKQTLLSLFAGVWVGATILHAWNPIEGLIRVISDFVVPSVSDKGNASLLILVCLAGGFIYSLKVSGAAESFARIITKKINTKKKAQLMTWACAFLFSYTEPILILGTVMRPITDKVKVARVKLAYILHSMGGPLASFSPISSYGPFIIGLIAPQLVALQLSDNPWSVYLDMFAFNLYGLFAMLTVSFVVLTGFDIGGMYKAQKRADETGELIGENDIPMVSEKEENPLPPDYRPSLWNFLVPMCLLFVGIFFVIFWTGEVGKNGFVGAFLNGDIVTAISIGFLAGAVGASTMAIVTRLRTFQQSVDDWVKGVKQMMNVPLILVMVWSIGSVTSKMGVGVYITQLIDGFLPVSIVPACIFVIGALISFATGSSWGVWAILMPIAIPMAHSLDLSLPLVIGAVISSGLFGNHCSPIADTTVMTATAAACDNIEHVRTQLPYALIIAATTVCGFLIGGMTGQAIPSLFGQAVLIVIVFWILNKKVRRKASVKQSVGTIV
ncbi:sodium:proton antiporter [Brevibacillus reuszeri]|uniref:Na+/H+ antiporter NhaC family protein n=1 Tax=Brevibacillus reuszeri TaxID=54915 RepID=UPI001B2823CA|nr:Na+/H+ antiporter NhaC family protein [Brevibacillus reuszeri]GIO08073.1 sodium:proton antiporter [Brevibacillus reuszeri]